MQIARRHFLRLASGFAALPLASYSARAQTYPAHPVRLIVGFPAGGQVDIIARLVGQALGDRIGQSVVVENRPGAGGNLGAQAVISAAPDGYTLFFGASSNTINTTLFANLPYDFARDITPVAPLNRIPLVLEVNPAFPAKNVAEFIAYAKANPGKLNVGSPSAGTPPYLCVESAQDDGRHRCRARAVCRREPDGDGPARRSDHGRLRRHLRRASATSRLASCARSV